MITGCCAPNAITGLPAAPHTAATKVAARFLLTTTCSGTRAVDATCCRRVTNGPVRRSRTAHSHDLLDGRVETPEAHRPTQVPDGEGASQPRQLTECSPAPVVGREAEAQAPQVGQGGPPSCWGDGDRVR